MKRCLTGFLALLLLLSLCACGEPQQTEQTGQEPEETTQPEEPPFDPVVPASQAVSADWFQDAAFIGDSVSVMLETYNDSYGRLSSPAFFCSVSLSQTGALTYSAGSERLPEYPKGSGRHPRLEDGVAESGAKKIYIMLGMNCIAGGVDRACQDLVTLIDEILAKSPQAAIFIQSVTPMTADSPRADDSLNNTTIQAWSPFQYGFFQGPFVGNREQYPELNQLLDELAEAYAATPTAIAAAWIFRHPAKIQLIAGTTSPDRMAQILRGSELTLTREDWYRLYLAAGHILP